MRTGWRSFAAIIVTWLMNFKPGNPESRRNCSRSGSFILSAGQWRAWIYLSVQMHRWIWEWIRGRAGQPLILSMVMKKKNCTVSFVITVKINLQKYCEAYCGCQTADTDSDNRRTDRDHSSVDSDEDAGNRRTSGEENFSGNPYWAEQRTGCSERITGWNDWSPWWWRKNMYYHFPFSGG